MAYVPDGSRLVSAGYDDGVLLWDVATGRSEMLGGQGGSPDRVAMSRDGARVAASGQEMSTTVWDFRERVESCIADGGSDAVAISPDGARVAVGPRSGMLVLWNVSQAPVREHEVATRGVVVNAAFSPDGTFVAGVTSEQMLTVLRVDGGVQMGESLGLADEIAVAPDGMRIAINPGNDALLFRRTFARWEVERVLSGHTAPCSAVSFSPDGRRLATGSLDRTARVWDLEAGGSRVLSGHDGPVVCRFAPDGGRLLTTCPGGRGYLWDLASGECRSLPRESISAALFSPDWTTVALAGQAQIGLLKDDLPLAAGEIREWIASRTAATATPAP